MSRNKRLVYIALLAAQAVIISVLERTIPSPFPFAPGARLGLANIVTCIALFTLPLKDTTAIIVIRLVLSAFLTGGISTFMHSASGAIVSFIGMLLVKQLGPKRVSIIGICTTGGVLHNFGQLLMSSLVMGTWAIMLYLPVLAFVGILSGIATGIASNFLLPHLQALKFFHTTQRSHQS